MDKSKKHFTLTQKMSYQVASWHSVYGYFQEGILHGKQEAPAHTMPFSQPVTFLGLSLLNWIKNKLIVISANAPSDATIFWGGWGEPTFCFQHDMGQLLAAHI